MPARTPSAIGGERTVLKATPLVSGFCISTCSSLSSSIEVGLCELALKLCFRFSCEFVARVGSDVCIRVRVIHCVIKSCLLAADTRTRHGGSGKRVLANTWRRIKGRARGPPGVTGIGSTLSEAAGSAAPVFKGETGHCRRDGPSPEGKSLHLDPSGYSEVMSFDIPKVSFSSRPS